MDLSQFYTETTTNQGRINDSLNGNFKSQNNEPVDPSSSKHGLINVFSSKNMTDKNIENLRRDLLNNYWEFDSRETI